MFRIAIQSGKLFNILFLIEGRKNVSREELASIFLGGHHGATGRQGCFSYPMHGGHLHLGIHPSFSVTPHNTWAHTDTVLKHPALIDSGVVYWSKKLHSRRFHSWSSTCASEELFT